MKLPIATFLAVFAFAPMGDPKEDIGDIERDTKALVFYLQDKKDHKEYCPEIDWKQPHLLLIRKNQNHIYQRSVKNETNQTTT